MTSSDTGVSSFSDNNVTAEIDDNDSAITQTNQMNNIDDGNDKILSRQQNLMVPYVIVISSLEKRDASQT